MWEDEIPRVKLRHEDTDVTIASVFESSWYDIFGNVLSKDVSKVPTRMVEFKNFACNKF